MTPFVTRCVRCRHRVLRHASAPTPLCSQCARSLRALATAADAEHSIRDRLYHRDHDRVTAAPLRPPH